MNAWSWLRLGIESIRRGGEWRSWLLLFGTPALIILLILMGLVITHPPDDLVTLVLWLFFSAFFTLAGVIVSAIRTINKCRAMIDQAKAQGDFGLDDAEVTPSYFSQMLVESLGCPCLEFHQTRSMPPILNAFHAYQEFGKDQGFLPLLMQSLIMTGDIKQEDKKTAEEVAREALSLDIPAWIEKKLAEWSDGEMADYKRDEGLSSAAEGKHDFTYWISEPLLGEVRRPHGSLNIILACIPETAPWRLPFWITPCGGGETPSMVEQMAFFRRWHEAYGAVPAVVASSSWSLIVARPPKTYAEAEALAWEHFAFCPDCVDQMGLEPNTIRALAEQLIGATAWHFWWD